MSKDNLEFGGFSTEEAQETEEFLNKGRGNFMKLKEGRNVVRILPPRPGEKALFTYFQHYVENADGKGTGVACPKKNAQLECPLCDYAAALEKGSAKDKERAKKFWATKRTLLNVIDRGDPGAGIKVLAAGIKITKALTDLRKETGQDFTDPKEGFDIAITRKGTGKNDTEYTVIGSRKNSLMLPTIAEMAQAIKAQPDLAGFAKILDADEITELTGVSVGSLPVAAQATRTALKAAPSGEGSDGFEDFLDVEGKDGNF